ncbi:uncharacterized protein PV09_07243 [Verruconis gallopava]|uniref:Methyltransferase type 11 domain-containing protein n=1 Tax=Verruconis gallopava TaxID=253628 RepID=A0A0D2APU9_9PEZI|nr:uncharacterized protein PV09_07243 [Verruconis gallopava]KIW01194.1 hypothetical protein PV09_07243 [Verruconis gallopava]
MNSGKETTFRNFTAEQAKEYNASRGHQYPTRLYEHILAYHKAKSGQFKLALDVGCGPGNATRDLCVYFDRIIGLDGSPGMINTARDLIPAELKEKLSFENIPSEQLHETPGVEEGSVDMVTVATAAHWFDLPKFYASALKVLRPGGTIAIWAPGRPVLKPETAHAAEINALVEEFNTQLDPYRQAGGHLARDMYAHLPLPWSVDPPVEGYDKASFERTVFSDAHGNSLGHAKFTLGQAERMYGSGSPIVRWREQHPDLAGTDEDIVKILFKKIRQLMGANELFEVDRVFGLLLWRKEL